MAEDDPTSTSKGDVARAGEPYQALYRRYRPQRFAEVRGQEHVTRALRNAVREGRVAHAYLFSGPRGTGKTSTARILAMALNCESSVDGEPDGTCDSCTAVRSGSSMDVFELDAASNRKLDEMRDLLSRVALGTPGRWKVYIVDEVHQLTPDAASALLKTLEEPPPHVVFVLATTDPQKVLPTIQSRTQHFEFHLLDGDLLAKLLQEINSAAGLGLSPEVVRLAVQKGRGSARDAESALEQLAAGGAEMDDGAPLAEVVVALAEGDAGGVLQAVARAVAAGREPRRLGSDLVERLREAFLASQAPSLVLLPAAETAQLSEEARRLGLPLLVRSMETVGQALVDMRDSVDPRVTLEVALVRLASPAADTSPSALLERIERLERAVGDRPLPAPPAAPADPVPPAPGPPTRAAADPASPARPSAPADRTAPVEPPPPSPSPGPVRAKAALGALLRGAAGATSPPPTVASPAAAASPAATASPAAPTERSSPPASTSLPPSPPPTGAAPAPSSPSRPSAEAEGRALPTRDELTKAWGDTVLGRLERPAQAYMGPGHFTEVSDAAVFALPDAGWVARASRFKTEVEAALEGYFGRPVPLRLVVDKGLVPPKEPEDQAPEEDAYDLDELSEAPALEQVSPEQRILDIFPGAVVES